MWPKPERDAGDYVFTDNKETNKELPHTNSRPKERIDYLELRFGNRLFAHLAINDMESFMYSTHLNESPWVGIIKVLNFNTHSYS